MTALRDPTLKDPICGADPFRRRVCLSGLLTVASTLVGARVGHAAGRDAPAPWPPLLLAREMPAALDPAGFLVSEKFDGVRAFWDGAALWTRRGHRLAAPAEFLAQLPAGVALDGELWLGHGRFEATAALLRRAQPDPAAWAGLRYQLFELPGGSGPFAQRVERLQQLAGQGAESPLRAVPQEPVTDRAELQARLRRVLAQGGEGLMLHRADAPYVTGRADVLYKFKPQRDADALVIGHTPGRGRNAGRVGALRVRDEAGREFLLGAGLSDAQREAPPPIGSWVTYTHRGETRLGQPRFATFLRLRDEP
jgi:DNA ligase-1